MNDRTDDRHRASLLAAVAAVALLVAAGIATAIVLGPLRGAASALDGVAGASGARAMVADASLRLLASVPLLVLVTAAVLAVPLRQWARRRAAAEPGRTDPLTGAATRSAMLERLEHATASSSRNGQHVAVMFLDLDGFKALNDEYHHDVGDRVLLVVAERLLDLARRTDLVCRYGGDEFVVVAEHLDGQDGAAVLADKVLATLRDPVPVDDYTFHLTGSLGIATCPGDTDDAHELVQLADAAMVEAKRSGGDTYRFSTVDLRNDHEARQATLVELRGALDANEFELVYQPQIDLRTGAVVGAEALLRWQRPGDVEPVPAGRFIALTENTGMAEQIGRWVVDTAVAQIAAWSRTPGPPLVAAVNIGLRHMLHGTLVEDVRAALLRHDVPPELLELELAEQSLAADTGRVVEVLQELKALGVRIVLDDFGTGQTSLVRLPELPLDAIKLDPSLGHRLAGSGAGMVAGLVGLGRELGLQVVIPRIEHAGQLRRARQLGCHRAQGYLVSPPVHADGVRSVAALQAPVDARS